MKTTKLGGLILNTIINLVKLLEVRVVTVNRYRLLAQVINKYTKNVYFRAITLTGRFSYMVRIRFKKRAKGNTMRTQRILTY